MKKFVVETQNKYGGRDRRLVPARDAHTARVNCAAEGTTIISCVPYTGQRIEEDYMAGIIRGCLAANKRKYGA